MWRAFDTAVRRKPLAGAADAVYGNSIDFRLEIVARSGIRDKWAFLQSTSVDGHPGHNFEPAKRGS
jgi:hypothetical protein